VNNSGRIADIGKENLLLILIATLGVAEVVGFWTQSEVLSHWAIREIESASGTVTVTEDGSIQVSPSRK